MAAPRHMASQVWVADALFNQAHRSAPQARETPNRFLVLTPIIFIIIRQEFTGVPKCNNRGEEEISSRSHAGACSGGNTGGGQGAAFTCKPSLFYRIGRAPAEPDGSAA